MYTLCSNMRKRGQLPRYIHRRNVCVLIFSEYFVLSRNKLNKENYIATKEKAVIYRSDDYS